MKPEPADIGAALTRWLHSLPDGAGPARWTAVRNVQPPIQGFSNETWLIELAHTSGPHAELTQPAVLRLQPTETGLFPSYDLMLQYRCMEALAGTEVPVPKLLGYARANEATNPFGRDFYVMQRMPGRCPAENPPYHTSGWLHDLPAPRQRAVWWAGVEGMARLHRLDEASLRERGFMEFLPPLQIGASALDQQLAHWRDLLAWAESLAEPYPLLRSALAWLQAHRPQDEPTGLCWGDPKLGNVLFDPQTDQLCGMLDWESAHLGNPVDDLAWWIVLDRSLCEAYGFPRLPHLPDKAQTVAYWEEKSGRSARDLPYYELLAAFKFAVIMARIGCLFTARGLVPRDMRMDLNNGGSNVLRLVVAEQGLPIHEQPSTAGAALC